MRKINFINLLMVSIFSLAVFVSANAKNKKIITFRSKQAVYLAEEPLPKIVARLKAEKDWKTKALLKHIQKTLPKVTPDIAKEKFAMKGWIDNSLDNPHRENISSKLSYSLNIVSEKRTKYPDVAICYIGPDVGYGLFAIANIKAGDIIAEYTGKQKTSTKSIKNTPYAVDKNTDTSFCQLDATHYGNAARFAQHFPSEQDIEQYQYTINGNLISSNDNVAIANSVLIGTGFSLDDRSALVATKDIEPFEQIGFRYSSHFGYEHNTPWIKNVHLFNKRGEIIPRNKYDVLTSILFPDQIIDQTAATFLPAPKVAEFFEKKAFDFANYKVMLLGDKMTIINRELLENKLAQPKDRLSIPAYLVPKKCDFRFFIMLLERLNALGLSKEEKAKILEKGKENHCTASSNLAHSIDENDFSPGEEL